MTDSMGPGKLVRHMENPSYTYDEYFMHWTGTKHIVRHMQKSVVQWSVISKFTCSYNFDNLMRKSLANEDVNVILCFPQPFDFIYCTNISNPILTLCVKNFNSLFISMFKATHMFSFYTV